MMFKIILYSIFFIFFQNFVIAQKEIDILYTSNTNGALENCRCPNKALGSLEKRKHFIKQDGKTVFKHAVKGMADVSEKILSRNNLTGQDISLFIPHQANKRIIDSAANRCGISEEKVLINIDRYGNTTAGTIPIAINEAVKDNRIKDGDYILLASFGAGFTWGSVLIKWESN